MKCNGRQAFQVWLSCVGLCCSVWGQSLSAQQSGGASEKSTVMAGAPAEVLPTSKPHDASYIIGNDDLLAISVWKEPDLTKSIPVRSDGKISLPLVGEMQATGKTPLQLEQQIETKLKDFITTPEVTVIVEQINSKKFNILGEIAKPGSYSIAMAPTIMDAIALAGGFRDFAKKTGVYVLRKGPNGSESRINFNYKDFIKGKNPDQNVKIEPNDTIIVP
jgi:polysaccharide export outer membrane protein